MAIPLGPGWLLLLLLLATTVTPRVRGQYLPVPAGSLSGSGRGWGTHDVMGELPGIRERFPSLRGKKNPKAEAAGAPEMKTFTFPKPGTKETGRLRKSLC